MYFHRNQQQGKGNRRIPIVLLSLSLVAIALFCGCGSKQAKEDKPSVALPNLDGKKLATLEGRYEQGPTVVPGAAVFGKGKSNRFSFLLLTKAKSVQADAVAIYLVNQKTQRLSGPYLAPQKSLEVKTQFRSQGYSAEENNLLYVANLALKKAGKQQLLIVSRKKGGNTQLSLGQINVLTNEKSSGPPAVGEKAIPVDTPTTSSVAGNVKAIDTRVPPSSMHEHNLRDVLGKKPVVLAFATPALCQSRVCGPVVDIVEQVKSEYDDSFDFIHMEIYNKNNVKSGFRPQVVKWQLPTEPWVFVIDANGTVAARFEGIFSPEELEAALKKVK